GLAREDGEDRIEPAVRLRIEPVELEPLDAMDDEQPEQRKAAQGIDHLDPFVGHHPSLTRKGALSAPDLFPTSTHRRILSACCSVVRSLPWTVLAKPHCGESAS